MRLRALKAQGFHFRRQAPLLGFYPDFACFRARLIVELDGGQHADPAQRPQDEGRDAILDQAGFRTLRVWNQAVDRDVDGVMEAIWTALMQSPHPSACGRHPPHEGEG